MAQILTLQWVTKLKHLVLIQLWESIVHTQHVVEHRNYVKDHKLVSPRAACIWKYLHAQMSRATNKICDQNRVSISIIYLFVILLWISYTFKEFGYLRKIFSKHETCVNFFLGKKLQTTLLFRMVFKQIASKSNIKKFF